LGIEPHGRKREEMTRRLYKVGLLAFLTGAVAMAQEPSRKYFKEPVPEISQAQFEGDAQAFQRAAKENEKWLQSTRNYAPKGRWWSNPQTAEMLGLTSDQVKKMDDIFQQHRLKLIDLNASLEKEEAILEPLVGTDQPDDAKVLAQIDKVAQARAELEKANSRMLWSVRRVLTPEQWKKLQSEPTKPMAPTKPVRR
jgi:Spy/CpxP family protein refolding chaperone